MEGRYDQWSLEKLKRLLEHGFFLDDGVWLKAVRRARFRSRWLAPCDTRPRRTPRGEPGHAVAGSLWNSTVISFPRTDWRPRPLPNPIPPKLAAPDESSQGTISAVYAANPPWEVPANLGHRVDRLDLAASGRLGSIELSPMPSPALNDNCRRDDPEPHRGACAQVRIEQRDSDGRSDPVRCRRPHARHAGHRTGRNTQSKMTATSS